MQCPNNSAVNIERILLFWSPAVTKSVYEIHNTLSGIPNQYLWLTHESNEVVIAASGKDFTEMPLNLLASNSEYVGVLKVDSIIMSFSSGKLSPITTAIKDTLKTSHHFIVSQAADLEMDNIMSQQRAITNISNLPTSTKAFWKNQVEMSADVADAIESTRWSTSCNWMAATFSRSQQLQLFGRGALASNDSVINRLINDASTPKLYIYYTVEICDSKHLVLITKGSNYSHSNISAIFPHQLHVFAQAYSQTLVENSITQKRSDTPPVSLITDNLVSKVKTRESEIQCSISATQRLLQDIIAHKRDSSVVVESSIPDRQGDDIVTETKVRNQLKVLSLQNQYLEIPFDDIEILPGSELGIGKAATVHRGTIWKSCEVAVKSFRYIRLTETVLAGFRQELSLLRRLSHPNVLKFIGACTSPRLVIVTEYCSNKSLHDVLNNVDLFWNVKLRMIFDAAKGLLYLHQSDIIHRDIKSHNLLVTQDWRVKVADFGLGKILSPNEVTFTECGTSGWVAPEVLRDDSGSDSGYSFKADVWSFSIVMWEMIATADNPFLGMAPVKFYQAAIESGLRPPIDEKSSSIDAAYISLIKDCWHSDPKKRPTFSIIVERLNKLVLS